MIDIKGKILYYGMCNWIAKLLTTHIYFLRYLDSIYFDQKSKDINRGYKMFFEVMYLLNVGTNLLHTFL